MMHKLIILLFCFLIVTSSRAQDINSEFDFVNIKEGVSKIGVSTIIQDHYGFIWLGTNGVGLNRFDGIDYVSYKHSLNDTNSISSNLIYSTCLDKYNRLWIGTEEGVSLYDRDLDHFKQIPIYENTFEEARILSIRSLFSDNNNLFIGTFGAGLFKLNLSSFKVERVLCPNVNSSLTVNSIQSNSEGKIFVGTNQGLLVYNHDLNELKYPDVIPFIKASVHTIYIDSHDNLWVGTEKFGLKIIRDKNLNLENIPISNNRILSIIGLPNGSILCGTENDGLIHLSVEGKVIKKYVSNKTDVNSIASNSIWSLFLDENKRIWMGYYNSGVAVFDELYDKFKNIESIRNNINSLQNASVTGLVKDDKDRLWIAMDGGGIDILDSKKRKFMHVNKENNRLYSGLTSDYLQCIFIDSKKNKWVGSWNNGLYLLKNGSKKFINYNIEYTNGALASNTILSIAEDQQGIIWIGTFYKGIHSFNPKDSKITRHNSKVFEDKLGAEYDVRKVLVDSKNNIWLGTPQGLFKVKKNEDSFIVLSSRDRMSKEFNNSVNANHILSLCESSNKAYIWIGTRGAGLCMYDINNDTYLWYNKSNGLLEENINVINESDNGDIWLGGNSGINKFDINTFKFTNYTYNDGLLSNDYNMNATFKDSDGILYFGNYRGIDFFNPNNIKTNTSLPSVFLTGFKLFNKEVVINDPDSPLKKVISETDSITLTHEQSVFTIEYSAINYTRPEKNQYAYYLDGLETSWNYVGDLRSATYTNLDQGIYTFKLKSSNNDGVWNETPTSLTITILPPWWKSKYALIMYLGVFALGLFLLDRLAKKRLKERQLIVNERDKRLQEKNLNEKKFQFFTNISHEFRTPLTLIINPLKDIINDANLVLPERVKAKHNIIYKNTDRLYRLINELLDFRKLELDKVKIRVKKLNLIDFSKNVVAHFKEEASDRNIQLIVDTDVANLSVWADEGMLEKIVFNILSNAFKVTPDGGAISINLLSNGRGCDLPLVDKQKPVEAVEINITDTGPGLEQEQINRIFERFYQVDNLNKTYYGGTGIGLEVVRSFVELHKGKVLVESEVGIGTTFKILLPIGKNHFKEDEILIDKQVIDKEVFIRPSSDIKVEEDSVNTNEALKTYTLLIVEDNAELRNYLHGELKSHYKVLTATNGKLGLKIAKESLPDIILTDVIMPEMDGFIFCKNIKSDLRTSHIPLLMLTAKTQIDDRMEGIETGADAYMVKPFDMRLLKLRLSQLITSRQLIFNKYFSVISDAKANTNTTPLDKDFINKVLDYINDNIGNPDLSVEVLASQLNLSRSQFYRKIKALTNQTANEFLRNIRLQKAKQIIENGNSNISEVCYQIGFSSPSYFTKCFKNYFGLLPTEIKKK
jgi:signal transduction histidine kinase/ligand-binding sensor domain-containing protein/DNA-binding response OmpR family regulator